MAGGVDVVAETVETVETFDALATRRAAEAAYGPTARASSSRVRN
jgi:hypothetical protein